MFLCEETYADQLAAFPLNLVVLTARSDAPQPPATPVTDCAASDTGWPCVHPNSLAEYFVDESGDPVCMDTADPDTCIRFELGAVAYRADLEASSAATDCAKALALADEFDDGDGTVYSDFEAWSDGIWAEVHACPDELLFSRDMVNVYLMDNPDDNHGNNTSFNVVCADCTMPVNFVDVDRLPWMVSTYPSDGEFRFVDAASEHEMGHGFGLDHACEDPFPVIGGDSNIMQAGPGSCCCEMAVSLGYATDSPWSDVCRDCSKDANAPVGCDDTQEWDDPDCDNSPLGTGDRNTGFVNGSAIPADWEAPAVGQVDRLLDTAHSDCVAECVQSSTDEKIVRAVSNELACHGGAGRFRLFPIRRVDRDGDGTGFAEMIPLVVSGDHLGRLSELTSISLVDLGGASRLLLPTLAQGWHFLPGQPDTIDLTGLLRFDSAHPSATPSLGTSRTGYLWGADGVDMAEDDWEWPLVDLVWGCNNDYTAPDVQWVSRPANAYRLHLSDIAGTLVQELLVRPDLTAMQVWFELRGDPTVGDRVTLSAGQNNTYTWAFSRAGLSMSGWLRRTGQPVGTTLEVHIDSATYGSWSRSNFTLPPLARLP